MMAKLRNAFLTRLKARGPSWMQRFVWNREFAEGRWNFIDSTADDHGYTFLAKYAQGGAIVDLGCGAGNTGNELEFRESIWYIPRRKLLEVLARYRNHLKNGGVFIARICDRSLRSDIVEPLRAGTAVVEERALPEERDIILGFK